MSKKLSESFKKATLEGDGKTRDVCEHCDFIAYKNPKSLVGVVASSDDGKILLVRRNIEPRLGHWDLPRGYLENGETTEEGAKREAIEEADAEMKINDLIGVYEFPQPGIVSLIYRAELTSSELKPGPEASEARLFAPGDIPWDELAFPHIKPAIDFHQKTLGMTEFQPDRQTFKRIRKDNPSP